jgi:hypothetical protein
MSSEEDCHKIAPECFQVDGVDERNLTSMVLSQHCTLPVSHMLIWRSSRVAGAAVTNPARATTEKRIVEARTNMLVLIRCERAV